MVPAHVYQPHPYIFSSSKRARCNEGFCHTPAILHPFPAEHHSILRQPCSAIRPIRILQGITDVHNPGADTVIGLRLGQ